MYILFLTFFSLQCSGCVQYETGVTTIQTILSKYLSLFFFSLSWWEVSLLSVVVCFHVCLSFFPSFLSSYSCFVLFISTYNYCCFDSQPKECAVGMMGAQCTIPCRYPSYGKGCQSRCYCSENNCNATTGCKGIL